MSAVGLFSRFRDKDTDEHLERVARVEQAEDELRVLQSRASLALERLNARHTRNHWQESVAQMIQGGH